MAKKATKDQKEQVKTLSYIDTLTTILGDYPEATLPLSMNVNPFGFLIDICKSLGIFDELLLFLVKLIQYEMPLIELGVKGILLANLKTAVSCSSDPYIPDYLRKKINSNNTSGITFSLTDLDYNNLMQINPVAQGSEYSYLGIPRNYKATYKVYQSHESTTIATYNGPEYLDHDAASLWLDKKVRKVEAKKKYKEDDDYKYEIEELIVEGVTSEETKNGDIVQSPTYTPVINVIATTKKTLSSPIINETKDYSTYVGADQFILSLDAKYTDYYEERGCYVEKKIDYTPGISIYELARAKDFNAFLWLVCHMIDSSNPISLKCNNATDGEWKNTYKQGINDSLKGFNLTFREDNGLDNINYNNPLAELTVSLNNEKYVTEDSLTAHLNGTKEYLITRIEELIGSFDMPTWLGFSKTDWDANKNTYTQEELAAIYFRSLIAYEGWGEEFPNLKTQNATELMNGILAKTPTAGILGSWFNVNDGTFSSIYDLCIKAPSGTSGVYTLIPATSDAKSLNWYTDRSKYFDFLKYYASPKKEEEKSPRVYGKEIGICNIEFDDTINATSQYSNFTRNQLRFTILPKPLIYRKFVTDYGFYNKRILFNNQGIFDSKGKFSVFVVEDEKGNPNFHDVEIERNGIAYNGYYEITTKDKRNVCGRLYMPKDLTTNSPLVTGTDGTTEFEAIPLGCLYETYPNLTIYEFNYDYIMSQRLFDPKVIAGQLIQGILNVKLGGSGSLNLSINHNITEGTLRQVVIDMVTGDTTSYTANDCYNAFSNAKYDNLLNETELKKSQGYHFEGTDRTSSINTKKIEDILSEYDNPDITQEGQTDVLTRAFRQAMVSVTDATEDTEEWDVKFDFISQLIQDLTFFVVESMLTPKFIMLIAVNKKLLDDDTEWQGNVLDNLLQILSGIITDIVKEIKNMMLQELLDFVLEYLKPKFEELAALIVKEYTEQYRDQLAALIAACGIRWGSGSATASTEIDKVTYADIDPTEEVTKDNQC